jgi:hypothetical protein
MSIFNFRVSVLHPHNCTLALDGIVALDGAGGQKKKEQRRETDQRLRREERRVDHGSPKAGA